MAQLVDFTTWGMQLLLSWPAFSKESCGYIQTCYLPEKDTSQSNRKNGALFVSGKKENVDDVWTKQ